MRRAHFHVMQPWGRNVAEQSTCLSEHRSTSDAFEEIDTLSERMVHTGSQ
jgi:hypothetical protein